MAIKQLTLPGSIVKKDNALVRSRTSITNITASRFAASLIAQINIDDVDFKKEYSIDVRKEVDIFVDAGGTKMYQLREAVKALSEAKVWIELKEEDRKSKNDKFEIILYFTKIRYENGILYAEFNPYMKPYLIQLNKFFTEYNTIEYIRLSSIYSQKLFELLKSYESIGNNVNFSVNDLHEYLDTPQSMRKDFRQFRRRILEKAEKDINERTNLDYKWEGIKTGKTFTHVCFKLPKKKVISNKNNNNTKDMLSEARNCARAKLRVKGRFDCEIISDKKICELCRQKVQHLELELYKKEKVIS